MREHRVQAMPKHICQMHHFSPETDTLYFSPELFRA